MRRGDLHLRAGEFERGDLTDLILIEVIAVLPPRAVLTAVPRASGRQPY